MLPVRVAECTPPNPAGGSNGWELVGADGLVLRVHDALDPKALVTILSAMTSARLQRRR